ncbi:hypothetical protein BU16DRAFT_582083 [Lophium mytilinum]|uniref:Uncharacterized protein n=1 Tax=Lophium mytilinum TaxID=390894 RepID=A0A6A6QTU8_9PEZI|nr:hypothetical protein BU16DRAFT_582083 [Lophium mytilinum]
MTLEFVGCILGDASYPNSSAHRLQTLELDNLMQWADTEPPLPKLSHLRALAKYFEQHESTLSVVVNTRVMVGALDPIVGCCSSLTSLRIGTVGEYEEYSENPRDNRLYSCWARFLASVRPTLQYFFFEQGPNRNELAGTRAYCRGRPSSEHRPMDRLFRNWILPVLLEAPWLLMRRMEIRGVGRNTKRFYRDRPPTEEELAEPDTEYDVAYRPHDSLNFEIVRARIAFPSAAKEKLRLLVGNNAELIIKEEASQDYDRLRSDDTGIPPVSK